MSDHKIRKPWGHYEVLCSGVGYQVKRLVIRPGESTSLQLHKHRSELWTIVRGRCLLEADGIDYEAGGGDSVPEISPGELHRVESIGNEDLVIIEVQMGHYLDEDDIIRIEDKYGRVGGSESE